MYVMYLLKDHINDHWWEISAMMKVTAMRKVFH